MTQITKAQKHIIINMTKTKEEQQQIKLNRWRGYNIAIIKDKDTALDKLQEILSRRKTI